MRPFRPHSNVSGHVRIAPEYDSQHVLSPMTYSWHVHDGPVSAWPVSLKAPSRPATSEPEPAHHPA